MFDAKFNFLIIIVDFFLFISGVLFWFSSLFSHSLGVTGFFSRLFAGIVCFIIGGILFLIGTRR